MPTREGGGRGPRRQGTEEQASKRSGKWCGIWSLGILWDVLIYVTSSEVQQLANVSNLDIKNPRVEGLFIFAVN